MSVGVNSAARSCTGALPRRVSPSGGAWAPPELARLARPFGRAKRTHTAGPSHGPPPAKSLHGVAWFNADRAAFTPWSRSRRGARAILDGQSSDVHPGKEGRFSRGSHIVKYIALLAGPASCVYTTTPSSWTKAQRAGES